MALQHLAIDKGLRIIFLLEERRHSVRHLAQSQDLLGVADAVARPCQHCRRQLAGMVRYVLKLLEECCDPLDLHLERRRLSPAARSGHFPGNTAGTCSDARKGNHYSAHAPPPTAVFDINSLKKVEI